MTIEQFGQTMQQRYPQYQGQDPAEVGKRAIAKYPQYSHMVDQPGQQPRGNFLGNLLTAAAQPFATTGKNIGAAAFEGGRALDQAAGSPIAHAMGNQNDYVDKNYNAIENPLMSSQEFQGVQKDPNQFMGNQLKASAGVASYAVPFGQGANMLTKAILPGMAAGGLQGVSDPNATPTSVAASAGMGAASSGATAALFKGLGLIGKTGNALNSTGDSIIRSQYKITPRDAAKLGLPEALQTLNKQYGLSNINDINGIADQVTGANGLITKLTREAVAKADNINTGGVENVAKSLLENEGILQPDHVKANFLNQIKNGVSMMASGGNTSIGGGDSLQALDFIKKLEGKAAIYHQANDPATQELGGLYGHMADHFKDLLFNGSEGSKGADQVLNETLKNPNTINAFHNIHPQLGVNFENGVKNVDDLRSLAAPFVRASIASQKSADRNIGQVINPTDIIAGILGIHGGYGLLGGATALAAEKALNSNAGRSTLGNLINKAAGGMQKLGSTPKGVQNAVNNGVSRTGAFLQQASQ